jgi:cell division protein FtsB
MWQSGPLALLGGAAALSLALVVFSLADAGGLRRLSLLRRDAAKAEAGNASLRAENTRLSRTVRKLGTRVDPSALERAARQQLGFVKQDELLFKFE